jgi:hypothetical protein
LRLLLFAALFLHAALATAQTVPACGTPPHRQFDFWLGTWDVADPSGKPLGRNRISAIHGGCALLEQWEGHSGFSGTSINAWDKDAQRWHQTWVDSGGGLLRLGGAYAEGRMRLEGEATDKGAPTRQRIDWEPQADGRVRQHWQASKDGGVTWTTVFDGWYRKVP